MRGDKRFHIVDLPIGSMAAMIRDAVPTRNSFFYITNWKRLLSRRGSLRSTLRRLR